MIRWQQNVPTESSVWQRKRVLTFAGFLDLTLPLSFEWTAELTYVVQICSEKQTRMETDPQLQRMKIETEVQSYIYAYYRFPPPTEE